MYDEHLCSDLEGSFNPVKQLLYQHVDYAVNILFF